MSLGALVGYDASDSDDSEPEDPSPVAVVAKKSPTVRNSNSTASFLKQVVSSHFIPSPETSLPGRLLSKMAEGKQI